MGPPGNTRLIRALRLGASHGFDELHLKLEGDNPTGSHKDRAAAEIMRWARQDEARGVTIGTCGNFGLALARLCRERELPCQVFIPARYRGSQAEAIAGLGGLVEFSAGGYEEAVEASQAFARREGYFDANPPGHGGEASIAAYRSIASEIVEGLGPDRRPASVWVPNGNGTTLTGIFQGFVERGLSPRIGACGSAGNTAVTASLAAGRVVELDPAEIHETHVNEPLLNWRSYHAAEALDLFQRLGGWVHDARDEELVAAARMLEELEGVRTTPASASALAGLLAAGSDKLGSSGIHVVVLTS